MKPRALLSPTGLVRIVIGCLLFTLCIVKAQTTVVGSVNNVLDAEHKIVMIQVTLDNALADALKPTNFIFQEGGETLPNTCLDSCTVEESQRTCVPEAEGEVGEVCLFEGPFREGSSVILAVTDKEPITVNLCRSKDLKSLDKGTCVSNVQSILSGTNNIRLSALTSGGVGFDVNFDIPPIFGGSEFDVEVGGKLAVGEPGSKTLSLGEGKAKVNLSFFNVFQWGEIEAGIPRYYPLQGDVRIGFEVGHDFDIVQLPIEAGFTVGVPLTDQLTEGLHRVTGVVRDRYPMLFGMSYTFSPTLANRDPFFDQPSAHLLTFGATYNIPLLQRLDLESRWLGTWQLGNKFTSQFTLKVKFYFQEGFDKYLFVTYEAGPEAPLFDEGSSLTFGLSADLETLLK